MDIGAGSGSNTTDLLEHLPEARVLALEPSTSMRSLLLSKIAAHPEWFPRVTVRPEDFFSATLPQHVAGAVLLGVFGHFDPGERAALRSDTLGLHQEQTYPRKGNLEELLLFDPRALD